MHEGRKKPESALSPAVTVSEIIKCHFIREGEYKCNHTWTFLFSTFGHLFTCKKNYGGIIILNETSRLWKWKNIKWGLAECSDLLPWPHSLLVVSKQREEEEEKTLDNHQCLQYLSSKRLKAHIAYNWIWFALPASVREIKGKHKNPHDSFSSRWQAKA